MGSLIGKDLKKIIHFYTMGYEKAKIYKLECEDGHYYYGSTINELRIRLRDHKNASKTKSYRVYQHINTIGWENVKIIMIEEYPCQNRRELTMKENEYIKSNKSDPRCLNNILAFNTEEERKECKRKHYEKNKETLAEYHRQKRTGNPDVAEYNRKYREAHKHILKQKKQEYYSTHKEQSDARNRERYYQKREQILAKKREKYHESKNGFVLHTLRDIGENVYKRRNKELSTRSSGIPEVFRMLGPSCSGIYLPILYELCL